MSGRNTKAAQVKVKRYWPGKAPEGVDITNDDYSSSEDEQVQPKFETTGHIGSIINRETKDEEMDELTVSTLPSNEALSDRRLQRLQGSRAGISYENRDVTNRYAQARAEVSEEEEEEDARAELKRVALLRLRLEEEAIANEAAKNTLDYKSEAEEEEESEYTSESSSEEEELEPMFKPVFVPKSQRLTIIEKERKEAEKLELEKLKEMEKEVRKQESVKMVQELVKKELEEAAFKAQEIADIDDTDDIDPEAEREAWKLRELKRIKRDAEEKAEYEKEQAEIERRRNLTEEERIREDLELVARQEEEKRKQRDSTKQVFLQKYHHKGAFFMDKEEDIYKRNYNEPAASDKVNRELLPKVLQVKNFGLAGRTKYTHLADQDTSQRDSPWNQPDPLVKKTLRKMGGLHDLIDVKSGARQSNDDADRNSQYSDKRPRH